ncbi:MAG: hypothetical protein OER88_11630, partial [Planctomycetota bacterium]|nr:hypothetical protein [Planctomycetota bacterium]
EAGADQRRLREAYEILMAWQEYGAPGPAGAAPAVEAPSESALPETLLEPTPLPEPMSLSFEPELESVPVPRADPVPQPKPVPQPTPVPQPKPVPQPTPVPQPKPVRQPKPVAREPELVVVRKAPPPAADLDSRLKAWARARAMLGGKPRDAVLEIAARSLADAMVGRRSVVATWSEGLLAEFGDRPDLLARTVRDDDILAELEAGLSAVTGRVLRHAFDDRDFARLERVARRIALSPSKRVGAQAFKGLHLWLAKCLALAHPPVASTLARRAVEVGRSKITVSDKLAVRLAAGTEIQDWPTQARIAAALMLLDGPRGVEHSVDGRHVRERLKDLPASSAVNTLLRGDLPGLPRRERPKPKRRPKRRKKPRSKAKEDVGYWIGVALFIVFALRACG